MNGKYRDVIRRFVRGDGGLIGEVASRVSGSSDLYESKGRVAEQQHQLCDLSRRFHSFRSGQLQREHNEANGEENRDGNNDNLSSNCAPRE